MIEACAPATPPIPLDAGAASGPAPDGSPARPGWGACQTALVACARCTASPTPAPSSSRVPLVDQRGANEQAIRDELGLARPAPTSCWSAVFVSRRPGVVVEFGRLVKRLQGRLRGIGAM